MNESGAPMLFYLHQIMANGTIIIPGLPQLHKTQFLETSDHNIIDISSITNTYNSILKGRVFTLKQGVRLKLGNVICSLVWPNNKNHS